MLKLTTNQLYKLQKELSYKTGDFRADMYTGEKDCYCIVQPVAYARDRHGDYHYLCVWTPREIEQDDAEYLGPVTLAKIGL